MDSARRHRRGSAATPGWRRDAFRTTLWIIPTALVFVAVLLFLVTFTIDKAAANGTIVYPSWVNTGDASAARAILTTIAASIITVVGVVFSVTIVALTLASTQFGPRMLRNFIRDIGTQLTLGTFVATFVFSVLALGSVSSVPGTDFVPHLSVSVALALTLLDLCVLIYFIHHVTKSIQLTEVVAGIARDLGRAIDDVAVEVAEDPHSASEAAISAAKVAELTERMKREGAEIPAHASGYLQAIGHGRLVGLAERSGAVMQLMNRPGHFLVEGRPLALVLPASAAPDLAKELARAHVVGPNRTLFQDLQFAIDQLVEIALRALSPAVNDTFTALTCIDWLGDAQCKLLRSGLPDGVYLDDGGEIRLIEVALTYERVMNRAFDKVRQAGRGMPAVGIRQLENLAKMAEYAKTEEQRAIIARQAEMIVRLAHDSVSEPNDVADVEAAFDLVDAQLHRTDRDGARTNADGTA